MYSFTVSHKPLGFPNSPRWIPDCMLNISTWPVFIPIIAKLPQEVIVTHCTSVIVDTHQPITGMLDGITISHDITWSHMASHDLTWHHMISHGITWQHLSSQVHKKKQTRRQLTWSYKCKHMPALTWGFAPWSTCFDTSVCLPMLQLWRFQVWAESWLPEWHVTTLSHWWARVSSKERSELVVSANYIL